MILMLETKQRFINTDHIVTAYIEGREDRALIKVRVVGQDDPISLGHYFQNFTDAEQALANLARTITESKEN